MPYAPYVLFKDIKVGDIIKVSDGYKAFTCLRPGEKRTVFSNGPGGQEGFYICCAQGRHYLNGQYDAETGELIGLVKV